ncbi:MAG TPA: CPBP family intramembrane glutamic endopeptidase [Rhizomicrobium sp.]|nr:CPBP family intramembrane glutamic endopeptidase [Rhizomicrobium sp.]
MSTTTPRIGPWAAIGLMILVFIVLEFVLPLARAAVTPLLAIAGPRDTVALRAASSIVLVWTLFAAACVILRLRGQSLRDIGWMRPARIWGWVLAVLFAALYGGFTLMGMTHAGAPVATDWSLWRIAIALGIGISAGICEETVFRGFLMSQARDGGAHWSIQIILSALLFGLAHVGWGGMSGHVQLGQAFGAATATAILGLMMAGTYVAGGRSLTPAIVAHGVIDVLVEPWLLLYAVTGGHF